MCQVEDGVRPTLDRPENLFRARPPGEDDSLHTQVDTLLDSPDCETRGPTPLFCA